MEDNLSGDLRVSPVFQELVPEPKTVVYQPEIASCHLLFALPVIVSVQSDCPSCPPSLPCLPVTRPVLGEETWSRTDTESQGLSGDEEETTHSKVETGQVSSMVFLRVFRFLSGEKYLGTFRAHSHIFLLLSFNLLNGPLLDFSLVLRLYIYIIFVGLVHLTTPTYGFRSSYSNVLNVYFK